MEWFPLPSQEAAVTRRVFFLERTASCLDPGHRHFLKGFLFKADKVPAYLPLGEMKTSQPAVAEGTVETKLPSPGGAGMNASVLFIIYSATCPDTVCVRNWSTTLMEVSTGAIKGPLKQPLWPHGRSCLPTPPPLSSSQINSSTWFRLQEAERLAISNESFSPDVSIIETAGQWGIIKHLSFAETAEWH